MEILLFSQFFLLRQFVVREMSSRYHGSLLGGLWWILTPLLMLAIFTLVFHGIFGMKWPGAQTSSPIEFALFLFVGLGVFQMVSEVWSKAPLLISQQPNLVTKVVFPLWILPLSSTIASALGWLAGLMLLLMLAAWTNDVFASWLLLPFVLLPIVLIVAGTGLALAAVGVFWRDLAHIMAMSMTGLMFLSPIFYPMASVPESWQFWFNLNPLTLMIEPLREIILFGQVPSLHSWLILYVMAFISVLLGMWLFKRLKPGFADVM